MIRPKRTISNQTLKGNASKVGRKSSPGKTISKTNTIKVEQFENAEQFIEHVKQTRLDVAKNVAEYNFNKKRVRVLSLCDEVAEECQCIVYLMLRDVRVQDNWAFIYAQRLALKFAVPLRVCYCMVPNCLDTAWSRSLNFLFAGLRKIETECQDLKMPFHVLQGEPVKTIPTFLKTHKAGALVVDFSPLREPRQWVEKLLDKLPTEMALIEVDAHNIVPCWLTSDKQEYAARTIRPKIKEKLTEFLTYYPPVIEHPHHVKTKCERNDWDSIEKICQLDSSLNVSDSQVLFRPGTEAGLEMLHSFVTERLKDFSTKRNDPTTNVLSNLSPWFHFGHLSPQRAALTVKKYQSKYSESVAVYLEEAIIRSELTDNFCFYNREYSTIKAAPNWAQKTLADHASDVREHLYNEKQLEEAKTFDPLWNAAQLQMVREGKMFGYVRMYWAKKILEWTSSPEEALRIAIFLNDKYSLDGRDPNGFVGVLWCIAGVHDTAWKERPIFGKIRFMNFNGCKRKFKTDKYIAQYSKPLFLR